MFFNRRKAKAEDEAKERQIQEIRQETFQAIDAAHQSATKLNQLLEKDGGITELIFLATGGDRRGKHR
jgi:hypothetical protein